MPADVCHLTLLGITIKVQESAMSLVVMQALRYKTIFLIKAVRQLECKEGRIPWQQPGK